MKELHIALTQLLRSESPSGKCTKLHTVAASNSRVHLTRSLYFCLFVLRVLFFAHILFVVNRAFSATPVERLQHNKAFCFHPNSVTST